MLLVRGEQPEFNVAQEETTVPQESDFVWGAEAIAKVIGRDTRTTFYLLQSGALKDAARKIGGRWGASRRKLLGLFETAA